MLKEYHGNSLYRLEYLPTVLIPIFFALIDSHKSILNVMPFIIGWCFLALGLFLMNDVIDQDRTLELSRRALFFLYIMCLTLGFSLIRPHGLYFALLFSVIGALYNLKLKYLPFFKNIFLIMLLGLPYLDFTSHIRILTIIPFFFLGLFAELVHSLADRDVTFQRLQRKTIYLAFFSSVAFLVFSVVNIIVADFNYYIPLTVIAILGTLGVLFIWNKPDRWPLAKKLGTEIFNLFTIYLLIQLLFR